VAAVAAYAWIHWNAAQTPTLAGLSLVLLTAVSAVVGAHLIAAYRARIFEHTWQQQQLVALTGDLLAQVEPQDVMNRVVEHARRLLLADLTVLAEHDDKRRLRRVSAISPAHDERLGRWLNLEVPDDVLLLAPTLVQDFLRIPEDDPDGPLAGMLLERGVRQTLFVAMRSGGTRLGNLAIARRTEVPFSSGEQLLARGLADQAALALRNARLVADLREASQLKSQFVSTVSHELRTPLNVILGFSEMGRDPTVEEAERLDCFRHIEMAGRDLLSLIESTLDIGRIEAGVDAVRCEPVALPEHRADLAASGARLPRRAGVELGHGHRHPPRGSRNDLRAVSPGGRLRHPPLRRDRPRALHRPALRRAARRHGRGREHGRRGLRFHGAAAARPGRSASGQRGVAAPQPSAPGHFRVDFPCDTPSEP
jgi:signal transduction histidine kinase